MDINKTPINTCFFGNRGVFSATVFNCLIQDGVSISKVFCASTAPAVTPVKSLPVSQPGKEERLDSLAHQHAIPVQHINNQAELGALNTQELSQPDFILIACFPFRLPEFCIRWPKLACLNIHPSLLPQYRGPDPLFWQFHKHELQTGVSLHIVTSRLDAGPIVNQKIFPLIDGITRQETEVSLAKKGADLFTELLTGNIIQGVYSQQQNEQNASYHPNPSNNDYEISLDWSAHHAFNFIRGTCSPTGYYDIKINGEHLKIISTAEYTNNGNISGLTQELNGELLIQFSPGILRVKYV